MGALIDIRTEAIPERLRAALASAQNKSDISTAASQLAKMKRLNRPRRWRVYTGRVGRKRGWRGMKVVLPDGQIGELVTARRGAAFVVWRDEFALNPEQHAALWVEDLRRFKSPAAVLLGSLKKGVVEKPSARKAQIVRLNGSRPVRPGSRPRGRPRR